MRSRRWLAATLAALGLGVTGLTGCGADDAPPPSPDMPDEALWNPCDALSVATVARALGGPVTKQAGTPDAPICRFTPENEGDPVLDANYSVAAGDLEEVIATFGVADDARTVVSSPQVAKADDARIIADVAHGTLLLSGFVQNGDLIQLVNVVAPKPYDRPRLVRGLRTVMADVAALADEKGVGDPAESPSSAPTG